MKTIDNIETPVFLNEQTVAGAFQAARYVQGKPLPCYDFLQHHRDFNERAARLVAEANRRAVRFSAPMEPEPPAWNGAKFSWYLHTMPLDPVQVAKLVLTLRLNCQDDPDYEQGEEARIILDALLEYAVAQLPHFDLLPWTI